MLIQDNVDAREARRSAHYAAREKMKPLESDWKVYNELVPICLERYLKRKLEELASLLSDSRKAPSEAFWEAKSRMDEEAKILDYCLGGHSRSKMRMSILSMHLYGLLEDEDLERFSEPLMNDVKRCNAVMSRPPKLHSADDE